MHIKDKKKTIPKAVIQRGISIVLYASEENQPSMISDKGSELI
jgi:hypothetical protein